MMTMTVRAARKQQRQRRQLQRPCPTANHRSLARMWGIAIAITVSLLSLSLLKLTKLENSHSIARDLSISAPSVPSYRLLSLLSSPVSSHDGDNTLPSPPRLQFREPPALSSLPPPPPPPAVPTRRIRPPSSHSCLVFMHIPKTAGTSLGFVLKQLANQKQWTAKAWDPTIDPPVLSHAASTQHKTVVYNQSFVHRGHITPRFLQATHTEACLRFTVLREPVDRVLSQFYFYQAKAAAALPQQQQEESNAQYQLPATLRGYSFNMTWEDCLTPNSTLCVYWNQYQNEMTRLLSGASIAWGRHNESHVQTVVNTTTLRRTQQFLWDTDLICFWDQLEMCVQRLHQLLNLTNDPRRYIRLPSKNVNEQRPRNVSPSILEHIRARNTYDLELYEWARATFLPSPTPTTL